MNKNEVLPVVDWLHKRDFPGVLRIEESIYEYEGWSHAKFQSRLKEKNVIGMVSKLMDVVGAFVVYEVREKSLSIVRFERAPELLNTNVGEKLLESLQQKGKKFKKSVEATFWEGEGSEKFQFFAKQGFKSKVKRDFFLSEQPFKPDGYHFSWDFDNSPPS